MNRTIEYYEHGDKIIRRDYNINNSPEKNLVSFIKDMSEKGLICSDVLIKLIKENFTESLKETKEIYKDSVNEILKGNIK